MLDAIATAIRSARDVVLLSCPFGLDVQLVDALATLAPHVLVYGILNTSQGGDRAGIDRDARQQRLFFLPTWIEQLNDRYATSVGHGNQIHVKSLVIDPWGSDPTVVLGSANFSDESVHDNDENTLLLRGNHTRHHPKWRERRCSPPYPNLRAEVHTKRLRSGRALYSWLKSWLKLVHWAAHAPPAAVEHVGVDLGSSDITVAKQLLNRADVVARF